MLKYFDGVERPFLIVPDNTSNFFRTGITATNSAIIGVNSGKPEFALPIRICAIKTLFPKLT